MKCKDNPIAFQTFRGKRKKSKDPSKMPARKAREMCASSSPKSWSSHGGPSVNSMPPKLKWTPYCSAWRISLVRVWRKQFMLARFMCCYFSLCASFLAPICVYPLEDKTKCWCLMSLCVIPAVVRVAGALQKSTEVMKAMQNLVKIPEIQATMRDLSKEMMKVQKLHKQ